MSDKEKRDKLIQILRDWALKANDGISFESIAEHLLVNGVEVPD